MVDLMEASYVTPVLVAILNVDLRTAHCRLREHRSGGHIRGGCGRSGRARLAEGGCHRSDNIHSC